MLLLGGFARRVGTKIGWEPEIHMAHINGSHGEIWVSKDIPGRWNNNFLGSLERAPRDIYLFFYLAQSAHLPHKTAVAYAGRRPQQDQHKQKQHGA